MAKGTKVSLPLSASLRGPQHHPTRRECRNAGIWLACYVKYSSYRACFKYRSQESNHLIAQWGLQVRMKMARYQYWPQMSKVCGCRTSYIWASKGTQGWQPARTLVGTNDVLMGDSRYSFNQEVQRQAFTHLSKPTCSIHSVLTNPGFAPFQGILGSGLSPCTTQTVICSHL